MVDLLPRHSDHVFADAPRSEDALADAAQRPGEPAPPHAVAAQHRVETRRPAEVAVEFEIVGATAAAALDVDELVVEHPVREVHLVCAQPEPPCVMSIKGTAASATTRMITK